MLKELRHKEFKNGVLSKRKSLSSIWFNYDLDGIVNLKIITDDGKECIKENIYIALGGVVTFKNAIKAKEVAAQIPLEYLLLETDDPYLAPVPFRGKENQPMYVKYVAEEIARLRNISVEEVARVTTQNAERIFNFNAE